ncbi:hypothetical protein GmHk_05G013340 [Glycine max]|nr:hypothetical protein GmHk_05G013340 [Glycine max]
MESTREGCYCNIPDFLLLSGFHTMTLHVVTLHSTSLLVRTLHKLKSFESNPFRDLENQLCLLQRSMTDPTNQHKTFKHALFSLTRFLGNSTKSHSSHNYSKPSTLNYLYSLIHAQSLDLSHYGVIQSGCYMPTSFCLVHPQTTPC